MFLSIPVEDFVPISAHLFRSTFLPQFVAIMEVRIRSLVENVLGISLSFDGWSKVRGT